MLIIKCQNFLIIHCVKSIQIRSFFRSAFSRIRIEYRYSVSLGIQSKCGKYGLEKTPYRDTSRCDMFSKYQCGFRKGYYLSNRKQRVKLNETVSSQRDIENGVPQESILGPLFFNIHLHDLFYFLEDLDIASDEDDTTLYTVKENRQHALETSQKLFKWFKNNFVRANSDKSYLLLSCNEPSTLVTDGSSIGTNTKEVLLGIIVDKDLTFNDHVNSLCKKACQKLILLLALHHT